MPRTKGSVTIEDVARLAGVAKGTVSRVLNNYGDTSAETRDRILQAVERLEYQPSAAARKLKRGRVDTLGIVLPAGQGEHADPFLSEFLDGIAQALDLSDRDLLVTTAHSDEHAVTVHDRLIRSRKVDGFIVTRTQGDDPRIGLLLQRGFPFVAHGRTKETDFAWYDVDNERAFLDAVRHVVALGHRRIGFLGGPVRMNFAIQRKAGYRRGLAEAGIAHDPALEIACELNEMSGAEAARTLVHLDEPPTALVCVTDTLAIGAIEALRALGLAIGRDVTVIGYDGLPVGAYIDPPLTTFSQSAHAAGARAAQMLIDVIEGVDPLERQELVRADLVKRASDGPPEKTPKELKESLAR
ncbi:LacI family DNA-binding transcriptional regulator [Stappia sp. GBMRC 2046]|uniref:LacI family DNA-binding transcriptional regulator n=1 Tax=Stappia sediminis TaxID=2692190 RepID=A0A7X3S975_9HYPH|nr:substrate-binding domain-containing protein [Stappia sediminis]MXN66583.1 LacI family DNA-binding transcriptional regulator [Stappia sediminis]